MWKNRSTFIFSSMLLIAAVLFCQMVLYAMKVLAGWELHFNLVEACSTLMQNYGLSKFVYVLDAYVFCTLISVLILFIRQMWLSRKAYWKLHAYRSQELTLQMNSRFYEGKQRMMIVEHASPIAFTMGLWLPIVVVSTGLMEMLDDDELEAVVHHEAFHQMHRDPLRMFILSLLASVMWYMPIMRWSKQQYNIIREVLADHYAIGCLGTSAHLGSALLKMLKQGKAPRMPFAHVSFADTSINYRIRQLLEPDTDIPMKLPFTPAIVSLQVLLALCLLFFAAMP